MYPTYSRSNTGAQAMGLSGNDYGSLREQLFDAFRTGDMPRIIHIYTEIINIEHLPDETRKSAIMNLIHVHIEMLNEGHSQANRDLILDALNLAERTFPNDGYIVGLRASYYEAINDSAGCIAYLTRLITNNQYVNIARETRARHYSYRLNNAAAAIEDYETLIADTADITHKKQLVCRIVSILRENGEINAAITRLTDFINVYPECNIEYGIRAQLYMQVGRYQEALTDCGRYEREPSFLKVRILYHLGRHQQALTELTSMGEPLMQDQAEMQALNRMVREAIYYSGCVGFFRRLCGYQIPEDDHAPQA